MITQPSRPLLLAISAPSGAGKTTLCDRLVGEFSSMRYSVSCTTRPPRDGEIDGVDYVFLDEDAFVARIRDGAFLEHAEVHGYRYGTLKATVLDAFAEGRDVLMDIDVQGVQQLRALLDDPANAALKRAYLDVFIAPPSLESLIARLKGRGKDSEAVIARRVKQAEVELQHWASYRYFIINDRLDASYDALRAIVIAEKHRILSSSSTP